MQGKFRPDSRTFLGVLLGQDKYLQNRTCQKDVVCSVTFREILRMSGLFCSVKNVPEKHGRDWVILGVVWQGLARRVDARIKHS